nr:5420_t:CDS:2 [Entrophospora candida]
MRKGKIKADPSKCEFMKKEVKILGKLVSEKGIRIPEAYLTPIENWKWPEGLESFNGRLTWMMDFIPNAQEDMVEIRKVINGETTGKSIEYKPAKEAFERLKEKIKKKTILGKADYNQIMKISLNQLQSGYSIPRLELMAINEGIDHFYADLRLSKGIQIFTDSEIAYRLHKNISTGKITESPKFLPLLVKHMELNKELIWIKRDKNKWSDLMTRIGLQEKQKIENKQIERIINKEKLELSQVEGKKIIKQNNRMNNQTRKNKKRKKEDNQMNNQPSKKKKKITNPKKKE